MHLNLTQNQKLEENEEKIVSGDLFMVCKIGVEISKNGWDIMVSAKCDKQNDGCKYTCTEGVISTPVTSRTTGDKSDHC